MSPKYDIGDIAYRIKIWYFRYVNIASPAQKIIEYDLNVLHSRILPKINEIVQAEHKFQITCNKNKLRYNQSIVFKRVLLCVHDI